MQRYKPSSTIQLPRDKQLELGTSMPSRPLVSRSQRAPIYHFSVEHGFTVRPSGNFVFASPHV
jgi:hypothetical protein